MPDASPSKSRSGVVPGAATTRIQAQIASLEVQKAKLVQNYLQARVATGDNADVLPTPNDSQRAQAPTAVQEMEGVAAAEAMVKKHIKLLHDYNDIKDIATGLLALIAEQRGTRLADVLKEFGAGNQD